jgi:hypothetical protein
MTQLHSIFLFNFNSREVHIDNSSILIEMRWNGYDDFYRNHYDFVPYCC